MSVRRVQKVVLREKVRRERWGKIKSALFRSCKVFAAFAVLASVAVFVYKYVFLSDVFMIKFVEIEPAGGEISKSITRELGPLRGRLIFAISKREWEQKIKRKYLSVQRVRMKRSFPDRIQLDYSLRHPVARMKSGKSFLGVDREGEVFPLAHGSSGALESLPELVVSSTESLPILISFLDSWTRSSADSGFAVSASSLKKVCADESGEISFYLDERFPYTANSRIVWGPPDPQNFKEKFARFEMICADLRQRAMPVQYINLREALEKNRTLAAERQMVARVIVRPALKNVEK